ncbi:MAG: transcription antitermination factor NusB [Thermoflavifilum sp.]|nr:transcription antitermination factor NusB [Thermoflavifilum sp.]MCL6514015.1 transcription antitermination factor NusB [Alicyclobacillus sp.]
MRRHEARQCALQALFAVDLGRSPAETAVDHVLAEREADDDGRRYVRRLVDGTLSHRREIDDLLASRIEGWTLDRLAAVDRNILRLAVYELKFEPDLDVPTVINEAVELAKEFGTQESGRFVNGVLSRVVRALPERTEGVT